MVKYSTPEMDVLVVDTADVILASKTPDENDPELDQDGRD